MDLSPRDLARYNRHLKLPGFGIEGQVRLKQSRVLLIGAGGLGCPIGLYLAGAGVGSIDVVDFDMIEISNLQRQIAHATESEGQPKAQSLVDAMHQLNPTLNYTAHQRRLDASWIMGILKQVDLVIDGTDNYQTRYMVADACHLAGKPLVYGAIHQFDAQLSLFEAGKGPCYRCLFPQPPDPADTPNCSDAGVLGVLPGVVGVMMATEAVKYLAGLGQTLAGVLALYNAFEQSIRHIRLNRDPGCPLCGDTPSITTVEEMDFTCETEPAAPEVDVHQAKEMIGEGAGLLDVREEMEWATCHIDGARLVSVKVMNPDLVSHFSKQKPLLVYCHKGSRSLKAAAMLREWGYDAISMAGGIDAWALTFDKEMPRY